MAHEHREARLSSPERADAGVGVKRTLAEDLILLLFQPRSGTIAGEGALFDVLGGAALADLGLGGHVRTGTGRLGGLTVEAVAGNPPSDHLLRAIWAYLADKPRGVQTVLAATGPALCEPLLDRLVERGELRRRAGEPHGSIGTPVIEPGDSGRRRTLLGDIRTVLVDGVEPTPRTAALAALLYGSGALPQFEPDIPWTSPVIARAEELKGGTWRAGAAVKAAARTDTSNIVSNAIAAAGLAGPGSG
ncbi:GOLPH3/VPS74 family protein [Myceligenerans xiligouense]|uniref:Golgi phosphoprotein 3 GPP34 n=1 Tax=Myceligenerans xiligouense TaxID=253184 RepID=A0A3N4YJN2_9MICO|nr:GPP34 family phosphoprotein [Myceligenerans xiligouense]RPF21339.1 Golgi phosphoprotein 3 GPP34 [Myceligenerans xiligouense]